MTVPIRTPRAGAFFRYALFTCGLNVAAGCARETAGAAYPPIVAPPWKVPYLPERIAPPVAPYVWPDPAQPIAKLSVPYWAGMAAAPYAATVHRAASYYQLPPELIWAVIKVESDFRDHVISGAGARGLMQLMPRTAKAIGLKDPLDPEQNILGGAYYLRSLANRFGGDLSITLAAYNAGPTAVSRHGGIPPYPETEKYVRKVLWYYFSALPVAL
jgi:soluble lytic murein transglycosylase-like protein